MCLSLSFNCLHLSSNVNEVIRAVLNVFIIFLRKYFTRTKKHKNAHKRTKIKKAAFFMRLENI